MAPRPPSGFTPSGTPYRPGGAKNPHAETFAAMLGEAGIDTPEALAEALSALDGGDERAAAVAYLGVPRRGVAREAAPVGEGAADLDLRAVELPVAVARAVV